MKVFDVILEISAAEKKRLKAERNKQEFLDRQREQQELEDRKQAVEKARQELARRKLAAQLSAKEPPPKVDTTTKVDTSNPLAMAYAQQQQQEDQIYGKDFKFQVVIDKRNKTKRLYGFWTNERIQRLEDVMRSRQYIDLGDFKGTQEEITKLFALFNELGQKYRQIYILFDKQNMREFPGLREVFNRVNNAYKMTKRNKLPYGYRINPDNNEIEQYIAWEEVDTPPEQPLILR